jgi:O-antigen ligase
MPRRLVEILLLVFLAAIGLNWPDLPFNARLTDLAFFALAVAVAMAMRTIRKPRLHPLDALVGAYLLGSVLATLASPDPRAGAVELTRHIYLASIYVVIAAAVRLGYAATIGLGLALSGAVIGIVGLVLTVITIVTGVGFPAAGEVMTLPYVGNVLRLRAFTASEAMFACILAMAVPFTIVRARARANHWGVIAALMIAAAFLTFSHSVAGVLVAALVAARPWLSPRRWAWRFAMAAVVTGVLVFNFAATISIRSIGSGGIRDQGNYHYGVDEGRTSAAGVDVEYAVISYFRLKQIAWDAFTSHPITGVGLDRFHQLTAAAYADGRLPGHYQQTDPHSTLFGRLAETGLAGTLPLIALWIGMFIVARELMNRPDHPAVALALFAGLCGLLVNTMNADVMNFRFLWVAAGLLRGLADAPSPESAADAMRPAPSGPITPSRRRVARTGAAR